MTNDTYVKHPPCDLSLHAEFWRRLDPEHRPRHYTSDLCGRIYMERLATHPPDWRDVVRVAHPAIWERVEAGPYLDIDVEGYLAYLDTRSAEAGVALTLGRRVREYVERVCGDLTPVRLCHGDLTLSNVMLRENGDMVFIDPGHHRGLPCRELDEAKLLQSCLGWDEVRYGRRPDPDACREMRRAADPVHWALLASHLIRLLCHDHPKPALDWAWKELRRIT